MPAADRFAAFRVGGLGHFAHAVQLEAADGGQQAAFHRAQVAVVVVEGRGVVVGVGGQQDVAVGVVFLLERQLAIARGAGQAVQLLVIVRAGDAALVGFLGLVAVGVVFQPEGLQRYTFAILPSPMRIPCWLLRLFVQIVARLIWTTPKFRRFRRVHEAATPTHHRRKPAWVINEVIRLKALTDLSCQKLADTFNRMHGHRRGMTISKSWVALTVKRHHYRIADMRRKWKRRQPGPLDRNKIWGVDLTGKLDVDGGSHAILGVIDHGSRLALCLEALPDKRSVTILGCLLVSVQSYHSRHPD
ncbi:hypothetical protein [Pseudoduganella violaceinigra]|uniref:hypothetical protein n=1 Tax=Pseudoduganella violaceinigra TaxID=246602 RepID=UPI001E4F5A70|nr:hypothetical protein [Pseudoduganella violaceinigra]